MPDIHKEPLTSLRWRFDSVEVGREASLREVVSAVLEHAGARDVAVVDEERRLLGVIDVQKLFRTVFFHDADPHRMLRQLIQLADSETAEDLMMTDPLVVQADETLGKAIDVMVQQDLAELPVVDEENRHLGSISMSAILAAWLELSPENNEASESRREGGIRS